MVFIEGFTVLDEAEDEQQVRRDDVALSCQRRFDDRSEAFSPRRLQRTPLDESSMYYESRSVAQPDLDRFKDGPLVGLHLVVELRKEMHNKTDLYYICTLCGMKVTSSILTAHVKSIPHKIKFCEFYVPSMFEKYGKQNGKWKSSEVAELTAALNKFEEREGRKNMAVALESEKKNVIEYLKSVKNQTNKSGQNSDQSRDRPSGRRGSSRSSPSHRTGGRDRDLNRSRSPVRRFGDSSRSRSSSRRIEPKTKDHESDVGESSNRRSKFANERSTADISLKPSSPDHGIKRPSPGDRSDRRRSPLRRGSPPVRRERSLRRHSPGRRDSPPRRGRSPRRGSPRRNSPIRRNSPLRRGSPPRGRLSPRRRSPPRRGGPPSPPTIRRNASPQRPPVRGRSRSPPNRKHGLELLLPEIRGFDLIRRIVGHRGSNISEWEKTLGCSLSLCGKGNKRSITRDCDPNKSLHLHITGSTLQEAQNAYKEVEKLIKDIICRYEVQGTEVVIPIPESIYHLDFRREISNGLSKFRNSNVDFEFRGDRESFMNPIRVMIDCRNVEDREIAAKTVEDVIGDLVNGRNKNDFRMNSRPTESFGAPMFNNDFGPPKTTLFNINVMEIVNCTRGMSSVDILMYVSQLLKSKNIKDPSSGDVAKILEDVKAASGANKNMSDFNPFPMGNNPNMMPVNPSAPMFNPGMSMPYNNQPLLPNRNQIGNDSSMSFQPMKGNPEQNTGMWANITSNPFTNNASNNHQRNDNNKRDRPDRASYGWGQDNFNGRQDPNEFGNKRDRNDRSQFDSQSRNDNSFNKNPRRQDSSFEDTRRDKANKFESSRGRETEYDNSRGSGDFKGSQRNDSEFQLSGRADNGFQNSRNRESGFPNSRNEGAFPNSRNGGFQNSRNDGGFPNSRNDGLPNSRNDDKFLNSRNNDGFDNSRNISSSFDNSRRSDTRFDSSKGNPSRFNIQEQHSSRFDGDEGNTSRFDIPKRNESRFDSSRRNENTFDNSRNRNTHENAGPYENSNRNDQMKKEAGDSSNPNYWREQSLKYAQKTTTEYNGNDKYEPEFSFMETSPPKSDLRSFLKQQRNDSDQVYNNQQNSRDQTKLEDRLSYHGNNSWKQSAQFGSGANGQKGFNSTKNVQSIGDIVNQAAWRKNKEAKQTSVNNWNKGPNNPNRNW